MYIRQFISNVLSQGQLYTIPHMQIRMPMLLSHYSIIVHAARHEMNENYSQKDKPFWILLKQEMTGWQWHQLDHMQVICTYINKLQLCWPMVVWCQNIVRYTEYISVHILAILWTLYYVYCACYFISHLINKVFSLLEKWTHYELTKCIRLQSC